MESETKSKPSSRKEVTPVSPATNKEVAKTGAASSLPAFMQADAASGLGKENIARDDMVVPRVALMQAVSEQAIEGVAEIGHFWHTVLEEDLGEELDIVIVHHSKQYILWNPRHSGGGILARASNGQTWDGDFDGEIAPYKDKPKYKVKIKVKAGDQVGRDVGLGRWGTLDPDNEDSQPAATLSHVLVCVAPDRLDFGPFVVLLQRSAEPVAKQLLSKVKLDPAPIFGQVYTMSSVDKASPSGDFKQFAFAKNGHVTDAVLYEEAKRQNEAFTSTTVKFNETEEDGAGADRGGGTDDGGGDY